MSISVLPVAYPEVEPFRELYRQEANCQIIHDSILRRGLADPYLIEVDGRAAGYGGVWNQIDTGAVMEFHTLPHFRRMALPMFRSLLEASGATYIQAQTNMSLRLSMLYDCATNIKVEAVLFADAFEASIDFPRGRFRRAAPDDFLPEQRDEPPGDWIVEVDGEVTATGGFLCHYNPPYGDVYMEVAPAWRRKGIGSFLVQELKRVCREAGKIPAARCSPTNQASRLTLEKAGLLPCGRLLIGKVAKR